MRRFLLVLMVVLFAAGRATSAYADTPVKKLGRGACNVLTFPLELPEQIVRVNDSDGPLAAMTYGLLKGVLMTGVRAVVGVYEVATFPLPLPSQYRPILTDPEFFLEPEHKHRLRARPPPTAAPETD